MPPADRQVGEGTGGTGAPQPPILTTVDILSSVTHSPDPDVSHAADTLSMMLGRKPDAREVAALDAYLVTVSDHGMNASTFTTRVVASTQADLFAAVTAGYCALTGPLHGGAPEPVLEMLDAIGDRERIQPWVDGALARGERLMGFGHRVYRVRDPRADVLKAAIERLAGRLGDERQETLLAVLAGLLQEFNTQRGYVVEGVRDFVVRAKILQEAIDENTTALAALSENGGAQVEQQRKGYREARAFDARSQDDALDEAEFLCRRYAYLDEKLRELTRAIRSAL